MNELFTQVTYSGYLVEFQEYDVVEGTYCKCGEFVLLSGSTYEVKEEDIKKCVRNIFNDTPATKVIVYEVGMSSLQDIKQWYKDELITIDYRDKLEDIQIIKS